MQLFVLALVLTLFMHDAAVGVSEAAVQSPLRLWALVLGPKLAVALIYLLIGRITYSRLGGDGGLAALRWMDRLTWMYRWSAVALFGLDLRIGALAAIRGVVGDLILLDELLVLAPTLAMIAWSWWVFYPIDIRLRQTTSFGRTQDGPETFALWTRWQYMLSQARHQIALMLVPLLLMMGWMEAVHLLAPQRWGVTEADPRPLLILAGAGGVFLIAPLMMRHIWDTAPLPAGELRHRLLAMCREHGVRVRELLLWRTFGGMVNAAVMGLVAPLRYILLTDALVQLVSSRQIEAVMAHEIGHVRRHHMFWLMAAAGATLAVLEVAWWVLNSYLLAPGSGGQWPAATAGWSVGMLLDRQTLAYVALAAAIVGWAFTFGWISRRFERQADTFAVQHLVRQKASGAVNEGPSTVDADSVQVMVDALYHVAVLNQIAPNRRSWRHGSIAWRQAYLRGLVGQPIDALGIDRVVRRINVLTALLLAALASLYAYGIWS